MAKICQNFFLQQNKQTRGVGGSKGFMTKDQTLQLCFPFPKRQQPNQFMSWFIGNLESSFSPGLDDPAGPEKDNANISEMVKKLKELDTVHLFFVIFNGQVARMTRFLP